jgi:transposase
LKAFLLRQARRYPGKTSWTKSHERWIADQRFDHEADRIALAKYQLAVQSAEQRVQRLTIALTQATQGWRFEPVVATLRALRGIDTVSAIGLVSEIGDINRFSSARQLMGYLGLVPSEHSSGNSIHRGSITKTGNAMPGRHRCACAHALHACLRAACRSTRSVWRLPASWLDSSGPSPIRHRPQRHRFIESAQRHAACGDAVRITMGRTLIWTIYRRPLGNLRV